MEEILNNQVEEKTPVKITLEDNGMRYTLEFDRESAMRAEQLYDLSIKEIQSGKTYVISNLFSAAFMKHHPHIKAATVERLWGKLENKSELYRTLSIMYMATAATLLDEPDAGNGISWKVQ